MEEQEKSRMACQEMRRTGLLGLTSVYSDIFSFFYVSVLIFLVNQLAGSFWRIASNLFDTRIVLRKRKTTMLQRTVFHFRIIVAIEYEHDFLPFMRSPDHVLREDQVNTVYCSSERFNNKARHVWVGFIMTIRLFIRVSITKLITNIDMRLGAYSWITAFDKIIVINFEEGSRRQRLPERH